MTEQELQRIIRGHEARNKELLRLIQSKGVNIHQTHFCEHHFWSPNQERAALLARELYSLGLLVLVISRSGNEDGSETLERRGRN